MSLVSREPSFGSRRSSNTTNSRRGSQGNDGRSSFEASSRESGMVVDKGFSSNSSTSSSTQVQVVDFDGNFTASFSKTIDNLGISKCGFNFNVVTVLGCQSSGKSTILNTMFGTSFPVMDASVGRSQTTKGIWAAKDNESNTLIIDVEGTDSKERGEDRLTFEHRASLFSLAIADAVLVNMWYHDLGRYSASNYGLLKTVLGVNLELFQQDANTEKTTMIFVIRDHSQAVTPLEVLEQMLHADLLEIWNDIKKPIELVKSKASDFFNFIVVGIPSKLSDPQNYLSTVKTFKKRWLKSEMPKQYSRKVPADGFAFYAKTVWDTILKSSELDIPSQKEMVASYRCEEIKQASLAEWLPKLQEVAASNLRRLFDDKVAEEVIIGAVKTYHIDAWRYQEDIYLKKRQNLLDVLFNEIQRPLDKFLYKVRQDLAKNQTSILDRKCRKNDYDKSKMADGTDVTVFWSNCSEILKEWQDETMTQFDEVCGHAAIDCIVEIENNPQPLNERISHSFETEIARKTLEEVLNDISRKRLTSEFEAFEEFFGTKINELRIEIERLYKSDELTHKYFWSNVTQICSKRADLFTEEFGSVLNGLSLSPPTTQSINNKTPTNRDRLALILLKSLKQLLIRRVDWIPEGIYNRFLKYFESDPKGVPYYWPGMTQDRIRTIYVEAKEKAEVLMPILTKFDIDINSVVKDKTVVTEVDKTLLNSVMFSEVKSEELNGIAATRMLKACKEAQFIQATGGKMATPAWWWWLLLAILGYNEAMAILRSPIFLCLGITALAIFGASYYSGNMFLLANSTRSLMSFVLGLLIPVLTAFQQNAVQPAPPPARSVTFSSEKPTPSTTSNNDLS